MLIKVVPEGTESMVFQASSHNDRFLFVGQINEVHTFIFFLQ